ncbi:MAG: HNH endonuclease signature motif containing protein [Bacilli bacterium]|nr:HNH endonuclease signature motif containing protein [Bacilli bacterium]
MLKIEDAEVDHIIPYSRGGNTTEDNAQLLHRHCNRTKNNSIDFEDNE